MIDASKISRGRVVVPLKVLVYGAEGVGKSTFAAQAPKPLFVDLGRGSYELDVSRVEPNDFDETLGWIEYATAREDVGSIVLDDLSRLEAHITAKVLGPNSTESLSSYGGGYGKGDDAALQKWRELLGALDRASAVKHVVLVGHALIKPFSSPTGEAYDKFELALRPKPAGSIKQWVNYCLFARAEVSTRVHEKTRRTIGEATGLRYLYTDNSAAYDAKHRGHIPPRLPLSWQAFADAVSADRTSCEEKIATIDALLKEVKDSDTRTKAAAATKAAAKDSTQLAAIIGRLNTIIEGQG